jgi:hypothetical protein
MSTNSQEGSNQYGVNPKNSERHEHPVKVNNIAIALIISSFLWVTNYFLLLIKDSYLIEKPVIIDGYERTFLEDIIYHLDSMLPILLFIFAISLLLQEKTKNMIWLIIFSIYWICEISIVWIWDFTHIHNIKFNLIYRMIVLVIPISILFYAISSLFSSNNIFHKSISFFLLVASCFWCLVFFFNIYYNVSMVTWIGYICMFLSPLQINIAILFIILALSFIKKYNIHST